MSRPYVMNDFGDIVLTKSGKSICLSDMFTFIVSEDETGKRSWLPKPMFDAKSRKVLKEKTKTVDASIPILIGAAEYAGYIMSVIGENEASFQQTVLGILKQHLLSAVFNVFMNAAGEVPCSVQALNERQKRTMDELFQKFCGDETDFQFTRIFRVTKNASDYEDLIKMMSNNGGVLHAIDKREFQEAILEYSLKALEAIHQVASNMDICVNGFLKDEKSEIVNNGFAEFMKDRKDLGQAAAFATISSASVETWSDYANGRTHGFYDTFGALRITPGKDCIYELNSDKRFTGMSVSECTTACIMTYLRFLSFLDSELKIRRQTSVEWYEEEFDDILAKCLGSDDFGRYMKTGKNPGKDFVTYAVKKGLRPFILRSEILGNGIAAMYCLRTRPDEYPVPISWNVPDFSYFNSTYQTELLYGMTKEARDRVADIYLDKALNDADRYEEENADLLQTIRELEDTSHVNENSEEIASLKRKISDLSAILEKKSEDIRILKEERETLSRIIDEWEDPVKEENDDSYEKPDVSSEEMRAYVNSLRILFIGGRWDMIDRLSEKGITNAVQISRCSQKFNGLQNPDVVVFMTRFMDHPMYYQQKNAYSSEITTNFNGTNLDQLISHVYSFGKELEEKRKEKEIPEIGG